MKQFQYNSRNQRNNLKPKAIDTLLTITNNHVTIYLNSFLQRTFFTIPIN